ncbi:MAG: hypothetical protein C4548_00895 [Desulfobacteraceae bacterium]|nr:MAG: hypothetical protein C4548_00895 [Desulfobacteraceae bacterium]
MKNLKNLYQNLKKRILNMRYNEPLMLDMLLLTPEIKEVWESKRLLTWDEGDLPVVSPKGLIKLKSMRSSGQDRDDIKNLESIEDED